MTISEFLERSVDRLPPENLDLRVSGRTPAIETLFGRAISGCAGGIVFASAATAESYDRRQAASDMETGVKRCIPLLSLLLGTQPSLGQTSLRFFGNDSLVVDRVEIELDAPHRPVDVGAGDFTIEWWMKAEPGANGQTSCSTGLDGWTGGNIFLDRDVNGAGDNGDWGVSLRGRRINFGVAVGGSGESICSLSEVDDGAWHHVAVARRESDGELLLWVDGVLESSGVLGPTGDMSYRDGRPTSFEKDPFLVIGAEKHDGPFSYDGWIDELRISTEIRYTGSFTAPSEPFTSDAETAALYHFDEGSGTLVGDSSGAAGGPSNGDLLFGGTPAGPLWSTDTPVSSSIFADGFESGNPNAWSSSSG